VDSSEASVSDRFATFGRNRSSDHREAYEAGRNEAETSMTEYAVVIERTSTNDGAWVPDLDGCVSTGNTIQEVQLNIAEAIEAHIESLREHGEAVPPPVAQVAVVVVSS